MLSLLILVLFNTNTQADLRDLILEDLPVVYYEFEETTGTTAADSSGNGNDGTYTGPSIGLGSPGSWGNGLTLPAGLDDNHVVVPDLGFCSDEYSIEFTIISFDSVDTGCCMSMYSTDIYPGDPDGAGGALHLNFADDGSTALDAVGRAELSATSFAPGEFPGPTHFMIVVSPEAAEYFIDGVSVGTENPAEIAGNGLGCFTSAQIAGWAEEDIRNFFGVIDEFAIYDYAVDAERVVIHANNVQPFGAFTELDPNATDPLAENPLDPALDQSATFTVSLSDSADFGDPGSGVTVTITFDDLNDPNDVSFTPGLVTFDSSNWSTSQTVTLSVIDDALEEACIEGVSVGLTMTASDPNSLYNGANGQGVSVNILDDDSGCIIASPANVEVNELDPNDPENQATVSYNLNRADPNGDPVVISVAPVEGFVNASPTELTFTSGAWAVAQDVTVKAVQDEELLAEGELADTVSATDNGGKYGAANVAVSIVQDECGQFEFLPSDYNEDCYVNLLDFSIFSVNWADCTAPLNDCI